MEVTLNRLTRTPTATIGQLLVPGIKEPLWTLEDLWRNNQAKISCVPAKRYDVIPHGWEPDSPVHIKKVWQLLNVMGREAILIHAGNTDKDTLGCILVGMGMQGGQLVNSRSAVDLLRNVIGNQGFSITINNLPKFLSPVTLNQT